MAVATYQLKSELARFCLPAPQRLVSRRLAWANSISILFLIIGLTGAQSRLPGLRKVPPLEQPAPVIVEPLPPVTPPTEVKPTEQQNEDEKAETPRFQAVTLDTPAINFSVPTPGSLLVPMSVAPTPAAAPLKQVAPVRHGPTAIQSTGNGGDRPKPDSYPEFALRMGQQGTVTLLLTVDDVGRVVSAEIKESSGSPVLDDAAEKWVKRHWIVPPVDGGHLFVAPIKYKISSS